MNQQIHPDCSEAFTQGLGAVFRQWTALELAVHNQWGGPNSAQKADELVNQCLSLFEDPRKRYKDEVSLLIEDFVDSHFFMVCEDGSPDEIGEILVSMWQQCSQGDFSLVHSVLAREQSRQSAVGSSQGIEGGDIIDDEMEGGEEGPMVESNEDTVEEVAGPVVDEDGFQTVTRKKLPRKCKK